jgi:hypothetical protein
MKLHLDSAAGLAARRLHDPLPEIQSREANGEPISGISSLDFVKSLAEMVFQAMVFSCPQRNS